MAGWVDAKVDGLAELKKNLNSLSRDMRLKGGERAIRAGTALIHRAAKKNVPVRTGTLKKSLRIVKLSRKGDGRPTFGVTNRKEGWYAHIVEFGGVKGAYTIKAKRKGGKKAIVIPQGSAGRSGATLYGVYSVVTHPQSREKPFLRPAFYKNEKKAIEKTGQRLAKFIKTGK